MQIVEDAELRSCHSSRRATHGIARLSKHRLAQYERRLGMRPILLGVDPHGMQRLPSAHRRLRLRLRLRLLPRRQRPCCRLRYRLRSRLLRLLRTRRRSRRWLRSWWRRLSRRSASRLRSSGRGWTRRCLACAGRVGSGIPRLLVAPRLLLLRLVCLVCLVCLLCLLLLRLLLLLLRLLLALSAQLVFEVSQLATDSLSHLLGHVDVVEAVGNAWAVWEDRIGRVDGKTAGWVAEHQKQRIACDHNVEEEEEGAGHHGSFHALERPALPTHGGSHVGTRQNGVRRERRALWQGERRRQGSKKRSMWLQPCVHRHAWLTPPTPPRLHSLHRRGEEG